MRERDYQAQLIIKLRRLFPGCVILKNDANYMQGVPDLTILWGRSWAILEDKVSADARCQPNQEYYIDMFNQMSFAAFIHPDNEEEVLHALQLAFESERDSRVP